ncbi:cytosine permease [Proteiniborus ethanoligenes]|uniref:Cytosine permease n=1 Tax=Proteiniborus ethanoligenes TaxID=415015 RepID=A0A1H3MX41_9FIRM|nr:cytosine permease [Proteiniborus ethanoligenes]SDY81053.1 cytosine permease [Proteiniborus ethanoligenes]
MSDLARKKAVDTEHSLSAVDAASRQGFWAVLVVMVGFTFFSPSMTAGGNLGIGLNMKDFFLAMILGNAFLGIYTGALAYIGQSTGLTLDLLARYSFGEKGSYLSSVLISFTQIGWFGVGVAMFALPVGILLGINTTLLIIVTGVLMTATAYYGIKALAVLGSVAVPLIAALGIYSVNYGINQVNGFANVFADVPAAPITMAAALSIVIGSFVSGGTSTPNFTRFSKTSKIAVWATVIAFFIGNSIMFVFGAVGGAVTGTPDIFDILITQGLMIPAIIVLGLNIWTTNNNALYTAGLGLANITKIQSKPMVLVGGGIGTAAALWLYNNFVSYLSLLGGMIPPVGVVIIIHFFMNRKQYETEGFKPVSVNVGAIAAVVVGAAAGVFVKWGIAPVNSLVVSAVVFFIAETMNKKRA